ncbi:MAG: hypothetical protein ACP5O0_10375 [Acidimicrobiales bacterium]
MGIRLHAQELHSGYLGAWFYRSSGIDNKGGLMQKLTERERIMQLLAYISSALSHALSTTWHIDEHIARLQLPPLHETKVNHLLIFTAKRAFAYLAEVSNEMTLLLQTGELPLGAMILCRTALETASQVYWVFEPESERERFVRMARYWRAGLVTTSKTSDRFQSNTLDESYPDIAADMKQRGSKLRNITDVIVHYLQAACQREGVLAANEFIEIDGKKDSQPLQKLPSRSSLVEMLLAKKDTADEPFPSADSVGYYLIYSGIAHGEFWAIIQNYNLFDMRAKKATIFETQPLELLKPSASAMSLSAVVLLNRVGLRLNCTELRELARDIAERSDSTLH